MFRTTVDKNNMEQSLADWHPHILHNNISLSETDTQIIATVIFGTTFGITTLIRMTFKTMTV